MCSLEGGCHFKAAAGFPHFQESVCLGATFKASLEAAVGRWQGHGAALRGVPASQQRLGLWTRLATGSSLWGLN